MAFVGEHTHELDAGQRRDPLGEVRGSGAGQDAEPAEPGIELDQHRDREPSLPRHARDARGDLVRVDRHGDGDAPDKIGEPRELAPSDDRVADEDVLDAGVGHHLGLAELRDLHSGRSRFELHACDLGQLVRLRVLSQDDAHVASHRGGSVDVRVHDVEVESDLRRVGRKLSQRSHPLEQRRFRDPGSRCSSCPWATPRRICLFLYIGSSVCTQSSSWCGVSRVEQPRAIQPAKPPKPPTSCGTRELVRVPRVRQRLHRGAWLRSAACGTPSFSSTSTAR